MNDAPEVLTIIRKVAAELGFEVETIRGSMRFMTACVRIKPDVTALDLAMPGMDGIALIRWLGDGACTARPIILSDGRPRNVERIRPGRRSGPIPTVPPAPRKLL